jgi:hypothetical protein
VHHVGFHCTVVLWCTVNKTLSHTITARPDSRKLNINPLVASRLVGLYSTGLYSTGLDSTRPDRAGMYAFPRVGIVSKPSILCCICAIPMGSARLDSVGVQAPYRSSFSRVKRPAREVDYWNPSSAEVKNEWIYTSAPPICLHGVNRQLYF